MFSDHHGIIIEISNRKNFGNFINTLKANNIFPKKPNELRKSWNTSENILRWIKNEDKPNKHMQLTQCLDENL